MAKVSFEFGLVIRKSALVEKSIDRADVFSVLEVAVPLDESEGLLTFGPHFGTEALKNFTQGLEVLGLRYWDDYIETAFDHPDWCFFSIEHERCAAPLNPSPPSGGEGQG